MANAYYEAISIFHHPAGNMKLTLALGLGDADVRQAVQTHVPRSVRTVVLSTDDRVRDRAARADVLFVSERWVDELGLDLLSEVKTGPNPPQTVLLVESRGEASARDAADEVLARPPSPAELADAVERLADRAAYARAIDDYYDIAATIACQDDRALDDADREELESRLVALRGALTERLDRLGVDGYAVAEEADDAS
jgi:hypothetical protein